MKKILKAVFSAAAAFITAAAMTVCASAETEDVELSTSMAKTTNGAWGQTVIYDKSVFDCSRITPDSVVSVEFELDGEWSGMGSPVELIFQNYSTADPHIWAKIAPFEYDETTASFQYEDMLAAYGSEDFSTVDNLILGDCGIVVKATKFTVTNCEKIEIVTTTTTEATTTTAAETTAAPETTTAAETTAAPKETGGGQIPLIPIVIAAVVVAVIVVVIIIVAKSKKRFY